MDDKEKYVRERWSGGSLILWESTRSYDLHLGRWMYKGSPKYKDAVWQAGFDFTVQREEEIRLVKEEIAILREGSVSCSQNKSSDAKYGAPLRRLLVRTEAHLAELSRDMVTPPAPARKETV
jgi:hypothetical protein